MKCSEALRKDVVKPPRVVLLETDAFASTWEGRPKSAIAVGLRCISESEETTADGEATKYVRDEVRPQNEESAVTAYNDALMRWLVGPALCNPNDASRPHEDFPEAEETLHNKLTSKTLRYLYEELERLQVETSPLHPAATDDEVVELRELLLTDAIHSLSRTDAVCARRFLMFALDLLREAVPDTDEIVE